MRPCAHAPMPSILCVMSTRHVYTPTSLGNMLLVATGDALVGAYFEGHKYPPVTDAIGKLVIESEDQLLAQTATELREYLAGERRDFSQKIAPVGDAFSQQVWQMLLQIPYGETVSYGQIATILGNKALSQRVGQSVGHNPISIIVPCHRVLGADGSLTGYAGGLDRKRTLLALEEPDALTSGRLF